MGYGLIICDVHLPGFSGLSVASRVEREWPDLLDRFVFTTGDNMDFSPEQCGLRDRTRVLLKPFEFSALRTLVADVPRADESAA